MAELSSVIPAAPPIGRSLPAREERDWTELARTQLAGLLEQIATVEAQRGQAERVHAALVAFGLADLPNLPWRVTRRLGSERAGLRISDLPESQRKGMVSTPTCVLCGHRFISVGERVNRSDGTVCRSIRMCDGRAATRQAAEGAA